MAFQICAALDYLALAALGFAAEVNDVRGIDRQHEPNRLIVRLRPVTHRQPPRPTMQAVAALLFRTPVGALHDTTFGPLESAVRRPLFADALEHQHAVAVVRPLVRRRDWGDNFRHN